MRRRGAPHAGTLNIPFTARDNAGIPHIVAKNFGALGYGEGYVFASDNLCTLANDIVTVRGERSKYFGPTGLAVNYSAGVSDSNLNSDLYWKYIQASKPYGARCTQGLNALQPNTRQIYTGFVAGYNRYLKSGKLRDPRCQGKPWVRPITLSDLILRGAQIGTEASSAQFISGLVAAAPPGATAARVQQTRLSGLNLAALKAQFSPADPSQGSNGIGLGALDTRAHHGLVLAHPHFPSQSPGPRAAGDGDLRPGAVRPAVAQDRDPGLLGGVLQRDLQLDRPDHRPDQRRALRAGVRRLVAGHDHPAEPERSGFGGDPDPLAGHRSDLAVVQQPDQAVLALEVGQAGLHGQGAQGRASGLRARAGQPVAQSRAGGPPTGGPPPRARARHR